MPAVIRVSLKTSPTGVPVPPVTEGVSRNDLRKGYEVTCESVHAATTYSWSLSFSPETSGPAAASGDDFSRVDSTASLSSTTAQQTKFTVDNEGPYLIRLVTDVGLPTEDVQFLRLRVMTVFGELFLVSAGERRDESGVIPVDVSAEGWANEQNSNIQRLMLLARRVSESGRVLYVDHNRGRRYTDGSIEPNDPTNIIRMPGPESARLDETGMRIACEGFADFSSINSAIAYALDCVSRGEQPLGEDNPYIIKIAPGFYTEDLTLVPNVHLVGDTAGESISVSSIEAKMVGVTIVPTTNAGSHHTYTASSANDLVVLRGITFKNEDNKTEPIIHQRGGLIAFDHCILNQEGSHASQGPTILTESNGAIQASVVMRDTSSIMNTGDASLYSIIISDVGNFLATDSTLTGDSVILYNPDFQDLAAGIVSLENCFIQSVTLNGYGFRGLPGVFVCSDSSVSLVAGGATPHIAFELVDTSGVLAPAASVSYSVSLDVVNSGINGDILTRTNQTTATVDLYPSSVLGGAYQFPTGAPNTWEPRTLSNSIYYDNAYVDPLNPVGPLPTTLPTNKVQNAIDMLVGGTFPDGPGSPYYSLDSAYDGLSSLQPFIRGDGLGREITADAGAVQIGGALTPVTSWLTDEVLTGGIQIEGNADIGPFVSGPPIGPLDNLGSEINMRPGTYSGAARMSLGRSVIPTDFAASGVHRGFPGGVIMGGNPNAMNATGGEVPFNLHLRTRNNYNSDTDELGRVIVQGGDAYSDGYTPITPGTKGGSVYIQGGTCLQRSAPAAEEGGFIFLAPGAANAFPYVGAWTPSYIRIVKPGSDTVAALVAANAFVVGGSGTFYLSGVNGVERFDVSVTDTLADVVNTINGSSFQFLANDSGGKLRIVSTARGPNAEVLFVASSPSSLNSVNLGELQVGSGAVFTAGTYLTYVDIGCSDTDELTIYGHLHATGDISADGVCCSGGAPNLNYQQLDFTGLPPASSLAVNSTARIVGVISPTASGYVVTLPVPSQGREFTIKDEGLNAGTAPYTIVPAGVETIDGAASVVVNVNKRSLRLYSDGTDWFII